MALILRTVAGLGLVALGAWLGRSLERSRPVREELRRARASGTGPVRVDENGPPQAAHSSDPPAPPPGQ